MVPGPIVVPGSIVYLAPFVVPGRIVVHSPYCAWAPPWPPGTIVIPRLPNDPQAPLVVTGPSCGPWAPVVASGLHSRLQAPLSQIGVGSS